MHTLPTNPEQDTWFQNCVRTLGSFAHTSTPAYTLAVLCALSTPFGFASPAQAAAEAAAKLQRQQQLAQASASASAKGSSGLVARLIANAQAQTAAAAQSHAPLRPLPPFWQLAFFSAAFATGGYMIDQGDALNGSGVVTAWSLTYLLFKSAPSLRQLPRNPLALSLSVAVLTLGVGVHGSHYFDSTSWRGTFPSFTPNTDDAQPSSRSRLVSFDTVGNTDHGAGSTSIFAHKPSATTQIQSATPDITTAISVGSARNNDEARTAAFLHRQAAVRSAHLIP